MKCPVYLSPTGIAKWLEGPEVYYKEYLADDRPPREPQTKPMAIGSAFDAYVKSHLHEILFGKNNDPKFTLDAIFEAQVEPHLRDWARGHGEYCFAQYKQAGALADLMLELEMAQGTPRFEFDIMGAIHGFREGVTLPAGTDGTLTSCVLMGKPDVHFINKHGASIVLDFKVNGYCSKASPMPGYLRLRSAGRTDLGSHKDCVPMTEQGMTINVGSYLERLNKPWARQLSIYAWMLGQTVGDRFILAIDQLACDGSKGGMPSIRIAEHRCLVSSRFQHETFLKACEIWEVIHSDHIFRDMTKEESASRCRALDGVGAALRGRGGDNDAWFAAISAGGW